MSEARRNMGQAAEDLVAARLRSAGWRLLERNARSREGELDIVAMDGRALVFVEVKAGRAGASHGPERPVLAVGPRKQLRLRRLARGWLAENRGQLPYYEELRFDVVGVSFAADDNVVDVEHIRNAF